MTSVTKKKISGISPIIRLFIDDAEIILFGSRARGDAGDDSDWDILIISNSKISEENEKKLRSAMLDYELAEDIVTSVIIRSREQWISPRSMSTPFHQNIDREGVILE